MWVDRGGGEGGSRNESLDKFERARLSWLRSVKGLHDSFLGSNTPTTKCTGVFRPHRCVLYALWLVYTVPSRLTGSCCRLLIF